MLLNFLLCSRADIWSIKPAHIWIEVDLVTDPFYLYRLPFILVIAFFQPPLIIRNYFCGYSDIIETTWVRHRTLYNWELTMLSPLSIKVQKAFLWGNVIMLSHKWKMASLSSSLFTNANRAEATFYSWE